MSPRSGDTCRLEADTADLDPPFAALDVEALRANAADLVRRAAGTPIRVLSKSVRCRAVLREVLAVDGFARILAYTLPEALWLAAEFPDVVVGYPTADRAALRLLGGRVHLGPRRSPAHTTDQARDLARAVLGRHGFRLVGLMSYEGQIAGLGDAVPGNPVRRAALRAMQRASAAELAERRATVVTAVGALAPLEFVNGGGTGSVERTAAEPAVTEVAAGSGLYGPTLFDHYRAFQPRPAALFALPVVRVPAPGIVTVLGGGWVASGPAGRDRLPVPVAPPGLRGEGRAFL